MTDSLHNFKLRCIPESFQLEPLVENTLEIIHHKIQGSLT